MIRCAFPQTTSRETSTPSARSSFISLIRWRGSTTTPPAITDVMWSYRMPDGISWSFSRRPSAITVWPALFPPW